LFQSIATSARYFVYILASRYRGTMYIGVTSDLEARSRERALKRWRREWKFELIEKLNPGWHDLSDTL
jgi:putative endonuclease